MRSPHVFGKYLLLERVSVGGMAEIFIAKAFGVEGFERLLAIKKILPTMAEDQEFITMFIDEARICAQLNHANIVHIHELGRNDDAYYIAMEYVSGLDLKVICELYRRERQPMPVAMAAFIASKVAEGLDYAHRKKDGRGMDLNIVHRDVSPQNVLLSYEGEVKLIDFGIAKAANRTQHTQVGILKGKFGYMSPEQALGKPIDHRSDLFAVGVLLYEMLTGDRLFVGESDFSVIDKVRNAQIVPPRELNPDIPKSMEKVMLQALAKDPADRYQWCSELQEDLLRFLVSEGAIFSSKHLSAFMKEAFAEDLAREGERMERYAQVERPEQLVDSSVEMLPQRRRPSKQVPIASAKLPSAGTPRHDPQPLPRPATAPRRAATPPPAPPPETDPAADAEEAPRPDRTQIVETSMAPELPKVTAVPVRGKVIIGDERVVGETVIGGVPASPAEPSIVVGDQIAPTMLQDARAPGSPRSYPAPPTEVRWEDQIPSGEGDYAFSEEAPGETVQGRAFGSAASGRGEAGPRTVPEMGAVLGGAGSELDGSERGPDERDTTGDHTGPVAVPPDALEPGVQAAATSTRAATEGASPQLTGRPPVGVSPSLVRVTAAVAADMSDAEANAKTRIRGAFDVIPQAEPSGVEPTQIREPISESTPEPRPARAGANARPEAPSRPPVLFTVDEPPPEPPEGGANETRIDATNAELPRDQGAEPRTAPEDGEGGAVRARSAETRLTPSFEDEEGRDDEDFVGARSGETSITFRPPGLADEDVEAAAEEDAERTGEPAPLDEAEPEDGDSTGPRHEGDEEDITDSEHAGASGRPAPPQRRAPVHAPVRPPARAPAGGLLASPKWLILGAAAAGMALAIVILVLSMRGGDQSAILVKVTPAAEVKIEVDGQVIPNGRVVKPFPPGQHLVVISAPGFKTHRNHVLVAEARQSTYQIELEREEPAPAQPPPSAESSAPDASTQAQAAAPQPAPAPEAPAAQAEPPKPQQPAPKAERPPEKAPPPKHPVREPGTHVASAPDAARPGARKREKGKTGQLACTSVPLGAEVFVDGRNTGRKTPVSFGNAIELAAGKHKLLIKLGRQSFAKAIEITPGEMTIIRNAVLE